MMESIRTGPWAPPAPAAFTTGSHHMYIASLHPIPETACGGSFDMDEARARCRGEAVERVTAWRPDRVKAPGIPRSSGHITRLSSGEFWHAGAPPRKSTHGGTLVTEVMSDGSLGEAMGVDSAAVVLSTDGWFPAGSCGLAAGPTDRFAWRSAVAEVRERDLVTRWWHGEVEGYSVALTNSTQPHSVFADGLELSAITVTDSSQFPPAVIVVATDPAEELIAVGAALKDDIAASLSKARSEAIVSLCQLRWLISHPHEIGMKLPTNRHIMDLPRERFTGFEHTLLALADPRFTARVANRFAQAGKHSEPDFPYVSTDPVHALTTAGHRLFRADLESPESRWAGLHVCRAICPTAHVPVPWCATTADYPVPVA